MTGPKTRVLIADDHELFRTGLRRILDAADNVEVVAEAATGEEAVETALAARPDVVLMDIQMPGIDGVEATREISRHLPETAVLIVTMYRQEEHAFEAVKAGARGYLLKDTRATDLLDAVRRLAAGEAILDPGIAHRLLRELAERYEIDESLTPRDRTVLALLAEGRSNKEIAGQLGLTEGTVRNRVSELLQKLHVRNRTEAAALALRKGLVPRV